MTKSKPRPTEINYHQKSRILQIAFDDGAHFEFSAEYLRVYSPSAEVRGHGPGQEVLQVGKEGVKIVHIEPVATMRSVCILTMAITLASTHLRSSMISGLTRNGTGGTI